MADTKLSALASYTPLAEADYVYGAQASGPTSKKIAVPAVRLATGNGLVVAAGGDEATAMAAGTLYVTNMSAWATADRIYTLPSSGLVVGQTRVGVAIEAGNATYELILKGATDQVVIGAGRSVGGGSPSESVEWSRLFIAGEVVIFLYVAANTWLVEHDGRVPQQAIMRLSTDAAAEEAMAFTPPTTKSGVWTAELNVGSIASVSNDRMIARRAGNYAFDALATSGSMVTATNLFGVSLSKNDTSTWIGLATLNYGASNYIDLKTGAMAVLAVDDYVLYQYRSGEGSRGLLSSTVGIYRSAFFAREIL